MCRFGYANSYEFLKTDKKSITRTFDFNGLIISVSRNNDLQKTSNYLMHLYVP